MYYVNYTKPRVVVLHDVDNVPASVYEDGMLYLDHIISSIQRIGHIQDYRMYLSNQNYLLDLDTIQERIMESLSTFSSRFHSQIVPPIQGMRNALDDYLVADFFKLTRLYSSHPNVFVIVSGDRDFWSLKVYGDVFDTKVIFLSPRDRQSSLYNNI